MSDPYVLSVDGRGVWVPCGIAFRAVADEYTKMFGGDTEKGNATARRNLVVSLKSGILFSKASDYNYNNSTKIEIIASGFADLLNSAKRRSPGRMAHIEWNKDNYKIACVGSGIVPREFWDVPDFPDDDWVKGQFVNDISFAVDVEFELTGEPSGMPCMDAVLAAAGLARSDLEPPSIPSEPKIGRPAAIWWEAFSEELAVWMGETPAFAGQRPLAETVLEEIEYRLRIRGIKKPSRSTAHPIIMEVLRRLDVVR